MIWASFFAGASAMLFAGIIIIWLIPTQRKREDDQCKMDARKDMETLHNYWIDGNNNAERRNDILQQISDRLSK